tara:strand:- start:3009 stop:4592 length:1584 start_codon:yes stop_codon:yes gene_type:complete
MKPITKRAQEARMRQNGVTPLKQVDVTKGAEITKEEKNLVTESKKETKQQGTSADDANQVAQGNKSMVTQPRPYTFEARATPKQKARQEVGAQKIRQRGADKLDKIADKQNRKRAGKELKGLKREAMDKKRLDGLTFKERREVNQAFRRGDYKSVLGSEDAKRATQLRGTKKGYTPDDEKPSTSSKPSTPQKPKNKMAEGMAKSYIKGNAATMKPVNIKSVPDLDKKAKPAKPAKTKKVKDKEFIKQNKLENREARKENRQANRAINKENRQANRAAKKENRQANRAAKKETKASNKIDRQRSKLNERMAVLEGNEAGSTKRAERAVKRLGRKGLREEKKVENKKAREQKKLDKAIDKAVKRGVKSSEKTAKKIERQKNSLRAQRAETKQIKEELKNDPATARLAGKSPEKVKKILAKDARQRARYERKTERKRAKGKLGPNESLVSPRDKRARKAYDEAKQRGGETYQEFQPENAPNRIQGMKINRLERKENRQAKAAGKMLSSPMKMMGVTGNSGPLKKGYFKNK